MADRLEYGSKRVDKKTNIVWNVLKVFYLGEHCYINATTTPLDLLRCAKVQTIPYDEFIADTFPY
jgi:hypothetical protein